MTPIASSKQRKTRSRSDSIGPATTPDIQTNSSSSLFNTPSFESDLFNSTLQFKVSNVSNNNNSFIRSRKHVISDSDEEESIEEDGQDEEEEEEDSEMKYLGLSMISFSFLAFIFGFWSIAIGPFLNLTGIQVLDSMAQDNHYKYLFIFIVPVTLYAVIINWWGLKIFRHA